MSTPTITCTVTRNSQTAPDSGLITLTGAPLDFCGRLHHGDEVTLTAPRKTSFCAGCGKETQDVRKYAGSRIIKIIICIDTPRPM